MNLLQSFRNFLTRPRPLPAQIHHRGGQTAQKQPYRLHLRLQEDGNGILVVNASLVLRLNQTAAEFAYHLLQGTPEDEVVRQLTRRYRVRPTQVRQDYRHFVENIQALLETPDLDPTTDLGFERLTPHTAELSAPLRLDCALTYRLPSESPAHFAPQTRAKRELSTAEWQHILATAWAFGIPHVIFTGGEPTLRPDLPDLITYAEELGMISGLLSDGLKLSESDYLQAILQSGLDHLLFLLQPKNPRSWEALQAVATQDLFTTAHITLTSALLPDLPQVLLRLRKIGINALSLSTTDPALRSELEAARQRAAELGLPLKFDLPVPYSEFNPVQLETAEETPAGAGKVWLYVEPDGDVLPAQGLAEQVLGNALRDPWAKIYGRA